MAAGTLVGRGYISIRPEFDGDWGRTINARVNDAGRSGGKGFSAAFGKSLSAGLKTAGGLAAVALTSNLAGAAASAAALAPALTTVATAGAAIKIGLSGVGDAFKAAFEPAEADAKAAAAATRQVESAERALANASRALADARVAAAERVRDAQRQVADAERDLRDAQRDARDVQTELNGARREAARALQDMQSRLSGARLDEREAVLRLKEAEDELKAAQLKKGVDPNDLARLQLAYDRAKQGLQDQRTETARLAADTKSATKAGVDGSQQVLSVRERIAAAERAVADRQRALGEAQAGVDRARVDGQRQVADAQRSVADAARALADAQAAAASQTSKLDEAMARLSPNAKAFVNSVREIAPAFTGLRIGVQDALFAGLGDRLKTVALQTLPTLKTGLTGTADQLNAMGKNFLGAVSSMEKTGLLDKVLAGANENLSKLVRVPGQLTTGFAQLSVAAQPAFAGLLDKFAAFSDRMSAQFTKAFESGQLTEVIDSAFLILEQVGRVLGDAFGALGNIMKAAAGAGGEVLGVVGALFAELRRVTALPEVQKALTQIFTAVASVAGALGQVFGAVLTAVLPILGAIAPVISQLATALGPVLATLATQLGAAIMPIVQALLPVVTLVGNALIQIVSAVTPLLAPIGQLIASIITALAPALTPIITVITQLVNVLIGPLEQIITGLTPVFGLIGQVIAGFAAELPALLTPMVGLIGQVANIVANVLVTALQELLPALAPLIPVGIQLVREVFGALQPVFPILSQALSDLSGVLVELLPPIAGIVGELVSGLAPILSELAPVFAEIAAAIVGGLAQILPTLTDAVIILLGALRPVFPVLTQLVGVVVRLAGDVLIALMPSLSQLITAAVQLLVALTPLIPPLAQLIVLGVRLATGVLTVVLPPLASLATFLVGTLAPALATVITWVSDLVTWVSEKLGPIFTWVGGVISDVVDGILGVFRWLYDVLIGHSILPDIANYIYGPFARVFKWLRDKIITPVWNAIKTAISTAWDKGIKPVFNTLKTAVGLVADAFEAAKDGIGDAWAKIKKLTKDPVKWVIDVVYNKGVRGLWNAAAKVLPGIDRLPEFKPKGWARGGIIPGYQSRQRDDVMTPMRRGEGVLVPEVVRGIGADTIHALNRAGNRGGTRAVRRAVGYASGGIVGAHGGIGDWFGGKAEDVGGAIKDAAGAVGGKLKGWVLGGVYKAAKAAAKPIRSLIERIPGGTTGFGALAKALPTGILNKALAAIKGGEDAELAAGGQWRKPVNAPFGTRFGVAGRMWSSGYHTGLDFPAAVGTAVRAVAAGQVSAARSGGPYGNHLLLNHGHGLQSLYAHLSRILVRSGAVTAGQKIGRVGATGNVTGPHLHLEARLNGKPVNPMGYLDGTNSGIVSLGGSGVQRWSKVVLKALGLVDQPRSLLGTVLRRMNQESGGDPNIVNRWDSNWFAGHPSVGLMQVIGPTFRRYAGRYRNTGPMSYGVSTNPLANIYASMRYAMATYGSLSRAYNRPGGYDSGGWLMPGWNFNGLRTPEAVLTPGQWRLVEGAAAAGVAGRQGGGEFTGDLYLDSGEWLGRVRGVVRQEQERLITAIESL